MSLHSSFYKFLTASDAVAALDGISSAVNLLDSDVDALRIDMDDNLTYHITQVRVGSTVAADTPTVQIVTMASDSMDTDGTYTPWTEEFEWVAPAALTGPQSHTYVINPPLRIPYSATYPIISMRASFADSADIPNISYAGFTTKA